MGFSWPAVIISLVIIVVAASQLDLEKLFRAALEIDPVFLVAALLLWGVLLICKIWKWMVVVSVLGGKISPKESLIALMVGLFVGVLTPGRLGDFVRAAYLKKQLSWGKGIMAVVLDRAMDILTLMGFSVMAIFLLSREVGLVFISVEWSVALLIVALLGLYVVLSKRFMKRVVWPIMQKLIPVSIRDMLVNLGKDFYESVPLLKQNFLRVIGAFLLGVIAWIFTITMGWMLMRGIGLSVPWNVALLTIPIISLIEILPVSVIGIGTRELASIAVLGIFGVSPEQALIFSLMYFAVGYIPSFLVGMYCFNRYPLHAEGKLKELLVKHGLLKQ